MAEDNANPTVVTRVTNKKDSALHPLMSYTAVTTHGEMADAFINEVLKFAKRLMPDREDLTIADLVTICHVALDRRAEGVAVLEGRQLRSRINDQLSRAKRYNEPFSLLVLRADNLASSSVYESVVDTLCERMRKTDIMFTFKHRVVLLLPHTGAEPCEMLRHRIQDLLKAAVHGSPVIEINGLTYPSDSINKVSYVLDWTEDQLRT